MYQNRLFFLIFSLIAISASARSLEYTISPVWQSNGVALQALRVQVSFTGDADGVTVFELPGQFGHCTHLYRSIRKLRSPNATSCFISADSQSVTLQHQPLQTGLVLTYEVRQSFPGNEMTSDNTLSPMIQPGFFHVLGIALFVLPPTSDGYSVTVNWRDFPSKWPIYNSFGSGQNTQHWTFKDAKWLESVFIGGDFRILKSTVSGQPVYLALRGNRWAFEDKDLLKVLNDAVFSQRKLWQDTIIPYYLVTLLPLALPAETFSNGGGIFPYSGVNLHRSFSVFATPANQMVAAEFQHLFHHEMMHHWIGGSIRNGCGTNDMQFAWFIEGFTEYLAWLNQLEHGLISKQTWLNETNDHFLELLYASPVGQQPNANITRYFFKQPDYQELPYQRGYVLALQLDLAIRQYSGGKQQIKDFMQALGRHYTPDGPTLLSDFGYFEQQVQFFSGQNGKKWIKDYVTDGRLVPVDRFLTSHSDYKMQQQNGIPRLIFR